MKRLSKDHYLIIYPEYFDSKRSRKMGRRVSKDLAVGSPKIARIDEACRILGLKTIVEPEKAYPRIGNTRSGRIIVFCTGLKKKELFKKISEVMSGKD